MAAVRGRSYRGGMQVFRRSNQHWEFNACIGYTHDQLEFVCRGYLRIVEVGLSHVFESERDLDLLFAPITFNWLHYLELRLKHLNRSAEDIIEEQIGDLPKSHVIPDLWKLVRPKIVALFPDEDHSTELVHVDEHIREIATFRRASEAFRYTMDVTGKPLLPADLTHVGYVELAKTFKAVSLTLEGASAMVENARSHVNEYRFIEQARLSDLDGQRESEWRDIEREREGEFDR